MYAKLLVFSLVLAAVVAGDRVHVCKTQNTVHKSGTSQPYSFPADWNENQTAPHLAGGQACSWVVTVPHGYFAKLLISGKMGDNVSHFQTIDASGNLVETQHEKMEPYYFPWPKFTLVINNEAPANVGFKIVWAPFPNTTDHFGAIGWRPEVVNITETVYVAKFAAITGISLLAFPADIKNYYSLRSTLVFDGNSWSAPYVNNLYEIYKTREQFVTSGNGIYVANLEARHVLDQILVQESADTADLNPYHELRCAPSSTCSKNLNGGKSSKSGLVYSGNQNQKLVDISMDTTATLSVYYGSQSPFALYQNYSGSTINSQLPLTFAPGTTQYIISTGKSTFTFNFSN